MAEKNLTFLEMAIKAIGEIKNRQGASRQAIANWIQTNHNKEAGGPFNAALRAALAKGIKSEALRQGDTDQRYKLGPNAHPKPKKKSTPKKATPKKSTPKKKNSGKKGSKKKTPTKKA